LKGLLKSHAFLITSTADLVITLHNSRDSSRLPQLIGFHFAIVNYTATHGRGLALTALTVFGESFQSSKQDFFNVFDCPEHSFFRIAGGNVARVLASDVLARQTIDRGPWRSGYQYGRHEQLQIPDNATHSFRELVTEN
jgi:hypothetical protein